MREWLQRCDEATVANDLTPGYVAGAQSVIAYIRAALDGPHGAAQATGGDREHPDTERMGALERMVAESAERGEAVEIDGRSPGLVLLSRWWPDGALEHVSNGPTLRAAIDAAMGGGHEQPSK